MQIKFIISALAALAVANPVPAEEINARGIDHAKITTIRLQSYNYALTQINQYPTAAQIAQAKTWWPAYTYSFPEPNPVWPTDLWSWYYCYSTYPQYTYTYWNYWNPLCPDYTPVSHK
ncbi:hypothetical protein AC579_1881 [Pseudocercospora musae]|uniref:Uncharacterized protein n=1 Tax=Pseudocercospora musae TaxID=113226 RepID=A0A139HZS3_9PEZI|nr:hypothetical protein AC579_1881 [Pseudocercospora musae]